MLQRGLLLLHVLVLVGCSPHILRPTASDPNTVAFPPLASAGDTLIGVALSGGGSRAAYFGASGLEALAAMRAGDRALLEQVTHLSSVSGGSVAASYYAMHKPSQAVPMLDTTGLSVDYERFFEEYRRVMGTNFQWGVVWRQFVKGRWLSSPKRAASLADVLDRVYLNQRTLADLYAREQRREIPRLILNATLYNDGRRVAMTTVPSQDFDYDVIGRLQQEVVEHSPSPTALPKSLQLAQRSLTPNTFEDFAIDGRQVPLSYAVAASASFPFLIGPISVARPDQTYLHVGDGGLFDNLGTESMVQLFLNQIQTKRAKRALVIAFDSSFPFWVKNTELDTLENGFKMFVDDPGRIVGIMEQRANAYQAMVWHILQSQQVVLPDDRTVRVIVIRHTDEDIWPESAAALGPLLPLSCRQAGQTFASRDQLREHLAMIPTKFKLSSACDRDLLTLAAQRGVAMKQKDIIEFLTAK